MVHDPDCRRSDAHVNGISKINAEAQTQHSPLPRTLPEICFELHAKIDAFLREQTDDDVLRKVQSQVKVSMGVIREALRRYG